MAEHGMQNLMHDYKRDVLGERYKEDHPIHNWLLYKSVAQVEKKDCDRIALKRELDEERKRGYNASADSLNSFWTTYKTALKIWGAPTYTTREEHLASLMAHNEQGTEPYREVNSLFASFATLAHARGNFMLVPIYNPSTTSTRSFRSLNTLRAGSGTDFDYWDLTLAGIESGRYSEFFDSNPMLSDRFNIAAMPGGFHEFIRRNHLEAYVNAEGSVEPLWPGHFDGPERRLPQTKDDVRMFLRNACDAIVRRGQAIAECETCTN